MNWEGQKLFLLEIVGDPIQIKVVIEGRKGTGLVFTIEVMKFVQGVFHLAYLIQNQCKVSDNSVELNLS